MRTTSQDSLDLVMKTPTTSMNVVSPAVTARYVEATRDEDVEWDPLPVELAPHHGVPTRNLLGYDDLQTLHPEGRALTRGILFPNDDQRPFEICAGANCPREHLSQFNLR